VPARGAQPGRARAQRDGQRAARQYLNRLSDLLFVLGRTLNRDAGQADVLWRHERGRG
jgi:cob(I)alamin adenosyltransferase